MMFLGSTVQRKACLSAAMAVSLVSVSALADDIDVYKSSSLSSPKPNILFVLDYSTSMGWDFSGNDWATTPGVSRIATLKSAMEKILDDNVNSINAGLGSTFSYGTTGIRWPISNLAADAHTVDPDIPANTITVKELIKQRINERSISGYTSTVDALVEAAQYFRGDPVTHNDAPTRRANRHQPATWNNRTKSYTGGNKNASLAVTYSPSDAYSTNLRKTFYCNDYSESGGPDLCAQKRPRNCKSVTADEPTTPGFAQLNNLWGAYKRCEYRRSRNWETPRFNSPISNSCEGQTNAIVLITDGVPTYNNRGASLRSLIPDGNINNCLSMDTVFSDANAARDARCAVEVVGALANQDVYLPGSRVKTYAVGFAIGDDGQDFLQRLSDESDTQSYSARNPQQLADALAEIVEDTKKGSANFAQLAVDVDKASFSHDDRVYYSLFAPSKRRAWQGNLKGYFVDSTGLVDIKGDPAQVDNVFTEEAQSFWSTEIDGGNVELGGASQKLLTGTRMLYTYVGNTLSNGPVTLSGNDDHRLRASNDKITNAMMGLNDTSSDTTLKKSALDWIQNAPMGDPLHTKSVGVNYGSKQIRYTMTNQGFLHAIDATQPTAIASDDEDPDTTGGTEVFAFMPKRLLKNLPDLKVNNEGEGHIYGLDGGLTRWHDDTDNDGIVNNNEKVMLYFGMRRGGSAYYAMDVSKYDEPKLAWVIDNTTTGLERLAQSWSRMSLIRVKEGVNTRRVLAFAGGYDASAQDDVNAPVESKGNAIYMVGEDGALLKTIDQTNNEHMKYSIASDMTFIDSDGDRHADRLYVGDLGGQVWRVDFDDISTTPVVTRLANLADQYHQPFFYPPSVSMNGEPGKRFLSVTLGSGNRTDPLLKGTRNNFYMIRDTDVSKGGPDASFSTVTAAQLYDATDNSIQSSVISSANAAEAALKAARGWRVQLAEGEKSLSAILTYEGKVKATTFTPPVASNDDVCDVSPSGFYFAMNVIDASPALNPLDDSDTDGQDSESSDQTNTRSRPLKNRGIASGPVVVVAKGDGDDGEMKSMTFSDRELLDVEDRSLSQVYWHAR